jgi:hypothetical protein
MNGSCMCGADDCVTCHPENKPEEKEECGTFDWRTYVMPWGQYNGDTFYIIYVNKYSYIEWLDEQDLMDWPELKKAIDAAITHKNLKG